MAGILDGNSRANDLGLGICQFKGYLLVIGFGVGAARPEGARPLHLRLGNTTPGHGCFQFCLCLIEAVSDSPWIDPYQQVGFLDKVPRFHEQLEYLARRFRLHFDRRQRLDHSRRADADLDRRRPD